MNITGLLHRMDESFAYKIDEHLFTIRLRTGHNSLKNVKLHYLDKYFREMGKSDVHSFSKMMKKVASSDLFDYYEINIEDSFVYNHNKLHHLAIRYYFELSDNIETKFYGNYKIMDQEPTITIDMFSLVTHQLEELYLDVPKWSEGAVFYQIFPERFCPTDEKYSANWLEASTNPNIRTNGTLRGITSKASYLKELGIDAIYLNPIFLADTAHRYDTIDYMKIDPKLGTEQDLKELVDTYHQLGIKVILDLVFNHSGSKFFAFQDVLKNQEKSRYKDWYFIDKFPIDMKHFPPSYQSFSYGFGMPKLNTENPETRAYLLKVARHYLEEFKVDGYRLDVADEVSHSFWREFRKVVKEVNKDALIMGEIWYEATPYMRGDEFDSIMNYNFYDQTRSFLTTKMSLHDYVNVLNVERGEMGQNYYHSSNILLGTHDTNRLADELRGDPYLYKIAMALLLFLPGAPIIYYGDEKMLRGDGRSSRGGMNFDPSLNKDIFEFIKTLIQFKHLPCLKNGEVEIEEFGSFLRITRYDENSYLKMIIAFGDIYLEELKDKINLIDNSKLDGKINFHDIVIYR